MRRVSTIRGGHGWTVDEQGYSGTRAAEIVGITYRQLDYWARTDLVRPSLADASGSGSRRQYSYRDLLELRVIKNLLDAGIKLESVRDVFDYLRAHVDTDIASAHLVISGSDVLLCDGDELIDVVRRGQGVLNVLPLAGVKNELDEQIVDLDSASATAAAPRRPTPSDVRVSELRALAARRRAPRARRQDGAVRRLGHAADLPDGHDRRAPGLPQRRGRVRRQPPRHGAGRGPRRARPAAGGAHQRPRPRSARAGPSTRTCSTSRRARCSTTSSCGGSTTTCSTSCPTPRTPTRVRGRRSAASDVTADAGGHRRAGSRGPRARWPPCAPEAAAVGRFRVHAGSRGRARRASVAGTGYTGEDGVELAVPADAAADAVGRDRSTPASCPPGSGARDTLRLEAGLPLHGHELGPGITPLQAGLGWVVAWTKPTFRGQGGAGGRARSGACSRLLRGIATEGRRPPRAELPGARRRRRGRATSPAATSRPCSATASPWPSCRPTSTRAPPVDDRRPRHRAARHGRAHPVRPQGADRMPGLGSDADEV